MQIKCVKFVNHKIFGNLTIYFNQKKLEEAASDRYNSKEKGGGRCLTS